MNLKSTFLALGLLASTIISCAKKEISLMDEKKELSQSTTDEESNSRTLTATAIPTSTPIAQSKSGISLNCDVIEAKEDDYGKVVKKIEISEKTPFLVASDSLVRRGIKKTKSWKVQFEVINPDEACKRLNINASECRSEVYTEANEKVIVFSSLNNLNDPSYYTLSSLARKLQRPTSLDQLNVEYYGSIYDAYISFMRESSIVEFYSVGTKNGRLECAISEGGSK